LWVNFAIGAAFGMGFEIYNQWNNPSYNLGKIGMAAMSGAWGGFATGMANNSYQKLTDKDPCKEFDVSDGDVIENRLGGASVLRNPIERAIRRIIPGAYPNGANYGTASAVIGGAVGESSATSTSTSIDEITDEWGLDTSINLGTITVTSDDCASPCK